MNEMQKLTAEQAVTDVPAIKMRRCDQDLRRRTPRRRSRCCSRAGASRRCRPRPATSSASGRCLARHRRGQIFVVDGAFGLRQVDADPARQPADRADSRARSSSTASMCWRCRSTNCGPSGAARSRWCSRSSACCRIARCSTMSPTGSRCAACRQATARNCGGVDRDGRARGLREVPAAAALGRPAAARRAGAGAGDGYRHHSDGRGVLGARSADPLRHAGPVASSCRPSCTRRSCSSPMISTRR